jgi:hypothetical protein
MHRPLNSFASGPPVSSCSNNTGSTLIGLTGRKFWVEDRLPHDGFPKVRLGRQGFGVYGLFAKCGVVWPSRPHRALAERTANEFAIQIAARHDLPCLANAALTLDLV